MRFVQPQIPLTENKTWVLIHSIILYVIQFYYAVNKTEVDTNNEIIIVFKACLFSNYFWIAQFEQQYAQTIHHEHKDRLWSVEPCHCD